MDSASHEVDGEAWRAELERLHAHLVNVIDQASVWARNFHVPTGDGLWASGSLPVSYPLMNYANQLERMSSRLKIICENASLQCLPPTWDRTTLYSPSTIEARCRDADWRRADFAEGGQYLLMLQPTSSHEHIITARQQWSATLRFANPSIFERELGMPQLVSYSWFSRSEFDKAYWLVHRAFRDSVAATFGRLWAIAGCDDESRSTAILVSWMKALTDYGCSLDHCESVLRDIEVVDPASVANCRAAQGVWLLEMP